jgi:hypothetical protein
MSFLSSQKAEVTARVIIQFFLQGCYDDSNFDSALFEMQIATGGLVVRRASILALNLPPVV